jgi:cytochrome P450
MFRKQGYKVLEFPFSFFDPPVMKVYNKKNNTNDSLAYVKENYPKYDVVVMNFANRVIVDIINPELVKHFLANDKIMIYPKSRDFVSVMERAIGKGIPFSEGQTWKRKRKIISEVFNFEFVASLTPRIGQICDESLDRLENAYKTDDPSAFKYHVLEYTIDMAANVMLECFFGNKFDKEQI